MRIALAIVIAWPAVADARDARVTATTTTTVYIDAGTADGLAPGTAWQTTIGGHAVTPTVAAIASTTAAIALDPPTALAIGATIALPPGLTPPVPATPPPPPPAMPAWRDDPTALATVEQETSRTQPPPPSGRTAGTVVSGELSLSVMFAADTSNSSTSTHEIALASQLSVASGPWEYDHLIEARLTGTPEIFTAPLQHAQAQLDVYQLRLAYRPDGARYAAALGRQPGAPLGELGTVDGARGELALDRQFQLSAFAGLRPASDLGLSLVPRTGVDLGWQLATAAGTRVRADAGVAVDEYAGSLDRALTAAAISLAMPTIIVHGDLAVDVTSDDSGRGPGLTHAFALVEARRGRLLASASGGYDRPFYDRALVAEVPGLLLGPRTFVAGDVRYALRSQLDIGSNARLASGDGFTSGAFDAFASWYSLEGNWRLTATPHAIVGSLVDELGLRGSFEVPLFGWRFDLGGSLDRVWAGGAQAWAGMGRLAGSRPFLGRWRTSVSAEVAAGDGPLRLLLFGLLGYRFGP